MSEWISVKEKLPEIDKKVLVFDNEIEDDREKLSCIYIGYYNPKCGYSTGWRNDDLGPLHVTHWMPLPVPFPEKTPTKRCPSCGK